MTTLPAAALAYANARWSVLPIDPHDKRPLCWHGVHDATTDERQVIKWWEQYPNANIGVRCDWFFVVDIDPRNGGLDSWIEFLSEHRPTLDTWEHNTWRASTGSGGTHFFFRHDRRLESVPLGKFMPGLDIKGNGKHYVLVPPSRTKGQYFWLNKPSKTHLYDAPEWMVRAIVEKKGGGGPRLRLVHDRNEERRLDELSLHVDRVARARSYVKCIEPAVSGQGGHDQTFVTAVRVCRGFNLTEEEGVMVMREWNRSCRPPWTEKELRRKVREALSVGQMRRGALL